MKAEQDNEKELAARVYLKIICKQTHLQSHSSVILSVF